MDRDRTPSDRSIRLLACGLVGLLALLLIDGARQDGVVADEPCNIPVGYVYLHGGPYFDSTHPPLGRYLYAAALVGLPLRVDPTDHSWEESCHQYGRNFLVAQSVPLRQLVLRARLATVALTLVFAFVLYRVARRLHGPVAGLAALALFATSPDVIAHGHLATLDMPAAFALFVAAVAIVSYAQRPTTARALLAAVAMSAALLVKANALVVLPMAFVMLLFSPDKRLLRDGGRLLGCLAAVGFLLGWASVGFRSGSIAQDAQIMHGNQAADVLEGLDAVAAFASQHGVALSRGDLLDLRIPGYLVWKSIGYQIGHALRPDLYSPAYQYLWGHYSRRGWHSYLAATFLLKTPIPFLLLIGWVIVRRRKPSAWLAIPIIVYAAFCLTSTLNIGHRYLLPIYPWIIVALSGSVVIGNRLARVPALLIAAGAAVTLLCHPRELGYLNRLAGPSELAWTRLVNSNVEWGQDVPRLVDYQRAHKLEPLYADVDTQGVTARDQGLRADPIPAARTALRGWVAITTSRLLLRKPTAAGDVEPYAWLRKARPAARIGDSIFVYWLDGRPLAETRLFLYDETSRVLRGTLFGLRLAPPWRDHRGRAGAARARALPGDQAGAQDRLQGPSAQASQQRGRARAYLQARRRQLLARGRRRGRRYGGDETLRRRARRAPARPAEGPHRSRR